MKFVKEGVLLLVGAGIAVIAQNVTKKGEVNEAAQRVEREVQHKETRRPDRRAAREEERVDKDQLDKVYKKLQDGSVGWFGAGPLSGLDDDEMKALLVHIAEKSSLFDGLKWRDKEHIGKILSKMAERDFHGTVAWIQREFSEVDQGVLFQKLIESAHKDNPVEALHAAAGLLGEDAMAEFAGDQMMDHGSYFKNDVAELCLKYMKTGSGSSGTDVKFHEDFDFEQFASAVLAVKKAATNGNESLSNFPTNFLEEWAKRDVAGAMKFYVDELSEGKVRLDFNGFSDLVKGYVSQAPDAQSSEWISGLLESDAIPMSDRGSLLKELVSGDLGGPTLIQSVMSRTENSNELLLEAYKDTLSYTRPPLYAKSLLGYFGSPEERLTALEKAISDSDDAWYFRGDSNRKTISQHLRALGHSDADVERIMEACAK